jgi:4-hydroxybenzoate polyprenyltransferase
MWSLFVTGFSICIGLNQFRNHSGLTSSTATDSYLGLNPITAAVMLVICILIYDFVLKRFLVSAFFMGLCRGLTLLLGASVALVTMPVSSAVDSWVFVGAASLTCYVMGLTWLARDESAKRPRQWLMSLGIAAMVAGLGGYVWMGWLMFPENEAWPNQVARSHLILVAVIGFTVIRSASMACVTLDPKRIRGAVKTALFSLITLDAANAMLASGGQAGYSVAILALLFVGIALSRFINPT